jgi:ATP-dependent RNA helicase RhlE
MKKREILQMSFSELGLNSALVRRCEALKYITPTPIQQQAIPVILRGEDLIGCASTGTGKTAAFLLPIIQNLPAESGVKVLILAPTRELASQIAANTQSLDYGKKNRAVTIVGGANIANQRAALRRGVAIVIATPGRLLDHIENGGLDLSRVETFVLDEADRMLDMGFLPAIRQIIGRLPVDRQTLLFSATMSPAIEAIARSHMRQPQLIEVNPRNRAVATVKQTAYPVALESKTALLLNLLELERFERVLIFTRTRRGAERLSHVLLAREHQVNRIHADRSQPQRESALQGFRTGRYRILVATDIAARGIDVEAVSHVINFDVPMAPEDYVHRIGRSGRAGNAGHAITLVTMADEPSLRSIEQLTKQPIERVVLPGFGGRTIGTKSTSTSVSTSRQFAAMKNNGRGSTRSFGPRRASR